MGNSGKDKSGTFDHRKVAQAEGEFLKDPAQLTLVFECKQRLLSLADSHLHRIINLPDMPSANQSHKCWLTAYELLVERIIRDDSPIAKRGEAGIKETLDEVCKGVSLREGTQVKTKKQLCKVFVDAAAELGQAQNAYSKYAENITEKDPAVIRIWAGMSKRFDRYGKILELSDDKVSSFFKDPVNTIYYVDGKVTGLRIGTDSLWEAGRIVLRRRPFQIYISDYHENTEEVLVPDQPVILQATPSETEQKDYFNGELFYVPRGVVVYIYRNIRHFAPLPVLHGMTTSPVIFRLATTSDEKDFHHNRFKLKRRIL